MPINSYLPTKLGLNQSRDKMLNIDYNILIIKKVDSFYKLF